ncbi:hypothetical protein SADUNF_Sadunf15G0114500 [Salix dunnii]|uniref:Uncharacterized protein n=1 Tax=Salix dunnii TaxID=1413687 RepID=A0A835MJP6_9ROSI|nr:hypothetical protein SADUNF_Sadunf15G0114500 [Salix dunnii]
MDTSNEGKVSKQSRSSLFSLSGTGFFRALSCIKDLGSQTTLALRLHLILFSLKISSNVNRPVGGEASRLHCLLAELEIC